MLKYYNLARNIEVIWVPGIMYMMYMFFLLRNFPYYNSALFWLATLQENKKSIDILETIYLRKLQHTPGTYPVYEGNPFIFVVWGTVPGVCFLGSVGIFLETN